MFIATDTTMSSMDFFKSNFGENFTLDGNKAIEKEASKITKEKKQKKINEKLQGLNKSIEVLKSMGLDFVTEPVQQEKVAQTEEPQVEEAETVAFQGTGPWVAEVVPKVSVENQHEVHQVFSGIKDGLNSVIEANLNLSGGDTAVGFAMQNAVKRARRVEKH